MSKWFKFHSGIGCDSQHAFKPCMHVVFKPTPALINHHYWFAHTKNNMCTRITRSYWNETILAPNKRKLSFSCADKISYGATCHLLLFDCKIACPICQCKFDSDNLLTKNCASNKTKFRQISARIKCEQRWYLQHLSSKTASNRQFKSYVAACEYLNEDLEVIIENISFILKKQKEKLKRIITRKQLLWTN